MQNMCCFCYFNFIINFIYIILPSCNGCFPTPQQQPVLTVCDPNPCTLSGNRVLITEMVTPYPDCAYTASATCTVGLQAQADMQFNGAGPNYVFPQVLICDASTGIFTYTDMGGIQQQANPTECVCRNSPCGYQPSFTPGQMVTFTPPEGSISPANIPDSQCYYRHQVTCNDNTRTMIRFTNIVGGMNSEDLPNPYDVFCPAGHTGYLYVSGDGQLKEAFDMPPGAAMYCPP